MAMSRDQKRCIALLKQARGKGWTLERLGDEMDVAFSTVSRWASGVSVPHPSAARRAIKDLSRILR